MPCSPRGFHCVCLKNHNLASNGRGRFGYKRQIKWDFSIALAKEVLPAGKMIYWTQEVCRDQRRPTSLRPAARAGRRPGPSQSLAPVGTLSAPGLLFNWPQWETKGAEAVEGGGLVPPAGHRRALTWAHYSDRRGTGLLMLPLEVLCWLIWKCSQCPPFRWTSTMSPKIKTVEASRREKRNWFLRERRFACKIENCDILNPVAASDWKNNAREYAPPSPNTFLFNNFQPVELQQAR